MFYPFFPIFPLAFLLSWHNHKIAQCQVGCPRFISVFFRHERTKDVEGRALSVNETLYGDRSWLLVAMETEFCICPFAGKGRCRLVVHACALSNNWIWGDF